MTRATSPNPPTASAARNLLATFATPARAEVNRRFFKTGKGEYGEGDEFLGVAVPDVRRVAMQFGSMPLTEVRKLFRSRIHEERLLAVILLVKQYRRADDALRARIFRLYLDNSDRLNNWDIIDVSAEHIVGAHLGEDRTILDRLARSDSIWERRIAILSTFHYVRKGEFGDTLRIAELLVDDEHDLIHKAVGWLLREVGKRDLLAEERFLRRHCRTMPRTMLRYAIEKFPEEKRRAYLTGEAGLREAASLRHPRARSQT